ncbi:hypothetical protein [Salegentibacter sp. Hel_I_6]|uniref:hypothetical protein n=1 Tax=Salegentibacter sp. Hel_I_6 TaxID=1250278 RepID=UPI0005653198|nr:hypothetical protein [Salegentibacter sp. Hel_I_6]
MQPSSESANIYPRTKENIKSIFLYYFPYERHSTIDKLVEDVYDARGLELNQIEFVVKAISENYDYLRELLAPSGFSVAVAYTYGSNALYGFPNIAKRNHQVSTRFKERVLGNETY